MDKRWCIYIDIEGFGTRYHHSLKAALIPFNALMEGIYLIGNKKYNSDSNRIFAHQLGDGFAIVSGYSEVGLERPISIAIALMRHVLAFGGIAKASISDGDFADIKSCYPKSVTDNEHNGLVSMGLGIMTITSTMGTALINAVTVDKRSPSGSLLTVDSDNIARVPKTFKTNVIENDLLSINWIRGEHDLVGDISGVSGLNMQQENERVEAIKRYISSNQLPPRWIRTTCFEQAISI